MAKSGSKQEILRVSTRLFAQRGFEGTPLQAIADDVGMRKPSLLYHYPSKDAIREAVIDELLEGWRVRLPEILTATLHGQDKFRVLFGEIVQFFRDDPNRALLIMRELLDRPIEIRQRMGTTIKPWIRWISESIKEGQQVGRVRGDVDPEAYLVECLVLIIGSFTVSDMAGFIFSEADSEKRMDRQLNEILRMTNSSLFTKAHKVN